MNTCIYLCSLDMQSVAERTLRPSSDPFSMARVLCRLPFSDNIDKYNPNQHALMSLRIHLGQNWIFHMHILIYIIYINVCLYIHTCIYQAYIYILFVNVWFSENKHIYMYIYKCICTYQT